MKVEKSIIRNDWSKGNKWTINGIEYRVGRMSYGDYFLEPGLEGRETEPFNNGTIWPETIIENGISYLIITA